MSSRTKLIPTSTKRFNELPPIPGLRPEHFDVFESDLFDHPNKTDKAKQANQRKFYRLGNVLKLSENRGPEVEYTDRDGCVRTKRLKKRIFLLNCCPDGMYFFQVHDGAFRYNVETYWKTIKPAVTDWWWTLRLPVTNSPATWENRFGFVFRSETDAILCSQLIETFKPTLTTP